MTLADQVVAAARSRIGDPYVWGDDGPDEFDCSGLVYWSYQQIGMTIPRDSYGQAAGGQPVSRDQLQPGDVIIYYPDQSHCALYSGNGNVIEASTTGVPVEEVPIDYAGPYNTARRYLQEQPVASTTLFGPDLSNNNWSSTGEIAGWLDDCFHREGYSWMEHKVSEGNYYADPYWPTVRDWCASNNVPCIGYHYVTTNDAASQVQTFINNGGGQFVMLDFEANSGDINNFWSIVNAFNAAGVTVTLSYIPHWYWQQIGSPDLSGVPGLISSSYYESGTFGSIEYNDAGGDNGPGWTGYGGATPAIWQFSDGAIIDGKSVDANAFKGSLVQLQQLLGSTPTPTPTPGTGPFMALTDQQQADLYNAVMGIAALVSDNNTQLRGPNQQGWPQLGQNSDGEDLTLVDALAAVKTAVESTPSTTPEKKTS